MKHPATYIALVLMLIFAALELNASKAVPKIQKIIQPDGTQVAIRVEGDHIFGYKLTLSGEMVELGPDGFLHYVELTPAGRRLAGRYFPGGKHSGSSILEPYLIREIRRGNAPYFTAVPARTNICRETKSSAELIKCPVLLVAFEDVGFTVENPKEVFNNLLNGESGSAADYFNSNFSGICTFLFQLSDVISLPYPIEAFGAQSGTFNDTDVTKLLKEACRLASEGGFDFSSFDMDADGIVENVSIIFAGHNESEGGGPETIWPHQQNVLSDNISYNGVRIASYTCTSELKGAQGDTLSTIGTFCHEFAHSLGLPDLYDTNGDLEGLSPALYGSLSIMDKGNFLNDGKTPPFFSAIEREILGIGDVVDLVPDTSYVLGPISMSHTVYRINTSNEGEYFLLEYRNRARWDTHIGGTGLVVYHVDRSSGVYGGLASSDRWKYNNVNTFAPHECAGILEAAPAGTDIGALFYPGTANVCELVSQSGNSPLKGWDGYAVGLGLKDIRLQGSRIYFNTIRDYSFNDTLPHAVECKATPYQKDAIIQWMSSPPESLPEMEREQWLVSWSKVGIDQSQSILSDSLRCCIYGLEPGTRYKVQVRCLADKEFGDYTELELSTEPVTSVYPFIYVRPSGYKTGEILDLRVFNLEEETRSLHWQVNGNRVERDFYIIGEEKNLEIELTIEYKDGSRETIYKCIKVR